MDSYSNTVIREISEKGEWEIEPEELSIGRVIGEGAFGVVRIARWRGTDVALKVINDKAIDMKEFDREIIIISKLHHPNILQFLGSCTQHVPYILVIEYMINGSLDYQLRVQGLNYDMKIDILKDISKGLAYLHNRKPQCIIHRDLKPSNVLLTTSFKAKIADFGISCLQNRSTEYYTMTGETGTYRYMAPEVMKHDDYNCKVDIWSFGMISYHMFVNIPFAHMNVEDICMYMAKNYVPLQTCRAKKDIKLLLDNTIIFDSKKRWDSLYLVNYCNNDLMYEKKRKNIYECLCMA